MEPLGAALAFCVPMADGGAVPTQVVEAYIEAYNRHDAAGIAKVFTADAEIIASGFDSTAEVVVARYRDNVFPRFPKVRLRIVEQVAAKDMVAQTETVTGIGESETGLSAYRVEGGCIVSMTFSK